MRHHRLTRSATLGLALVALVAPAAAAQAQDLRSPDARDASGRVGTLSPAPATDLRSPDARETSSNAGSVSPAPATDLRSPDARQLSADAITAAPADLRTADARDAADGRGTFNAPEVALIKVPQPAPAAADSMDWGDAGIGAGSVLALILLGLGGVLAVMHRRHGAPAPRETAIG
jgi:hypothetical protein